MAKAKEKVFSLAPEKREQMHILCPEHIEVEQMDEGWSWMNDTEIRDSYWKIHLEII